LEWSYIDGIHAKVAHFDGSLEPTVFPHQLTVNVDKSEADMAMGSTSFDDSACEIFEAIPALSNISANVAAVTAGKSGGVSAKHLTKLFSIAHDDAEWTLFVTTQRNRQSDDSSLSHNFVTNDLDKDFVALYPMRDT
jgi:hypothetical protein